MKEARTQAFANRKIARAGGDPLAEKRRAKEVPTFADAAAVVVEQKRSGWRNPKHAQDWPASLERFAFPRFGQRPVSEVTGADVLGVLAPIWYEKPETARRVRQRIGAVLQWAMAMEYRADNPCERVAATLGHQRDVVRHMRALPHAEVAEAVTIVRASATSAWGNCARMCQSTRRWRPSFAATRSHGLSGRYSMATVPLHHGADAVADPSSPRTRTDSRPRRDSTPSWKWQGEKDSPPFCKCLFASS